MILKGIEMPKGRKYKGYNGSNDPFYQTKQWKEFRKVYLANHPLCRICEEQGRLTTATVLDHINPRKQGGADFDEFNLQPLCRTCNAKKTAGDRTESILEIKRGGYRPK